MTPVRHLTVHLTIDGAAISGVSRSANGIERPFSGWLELITIVSGDADGSSEDERPAPSESSRDQGRAGREG